jgi:hypothetical protein
MVVVCELGSWQELILVVMSLACEDLDKLFEFLVDILCLAIGLWVVSDGHCRLYIDEAPQLPGEIHDKL